MNSFYSNEELKQLGLKSFGKNVLISKKCSIYGADKISIGNNVRIDDFCLLTGKIEIGDYVHISAYSALFAGDEGIYIEDFTGISARCTIWGKSDDYSGSYMSNPTVPLKYRSVTDKKITLKKHVLLGTNTVIIPGAGKEIILDEGTATGAMSLINKSTKAWSIYLGIPSKIIKSRKRNILEIEKELKRI